MNKIIALFVFTISFSCFAQGEANNWYFGRNAGITFNTNPPSALVNGELNTNEGCSSISDVNGNLLMYTDGRTIWNRNHEIMSNANYFGGTGLHGDPSSTSSGLIVPHPTDANLYYVFTVDEPHHENANAYPNQGPADSDGSPIPFYTDTGRDKPEEDDGFNNGLNYSLVDMSLNGGLGDVIPTERNNQLITYNENDPEEIKYKASEKITAVRGRNCNSVWLITHFRNKFYAFLIDEDGLDQTPVITIVTPLIDISNYRRAAIGYLKASPNADKLLIAHNTTNYSPPEFFDAGDGNVFAYDFDNLTGQVSNPIKLIDNVNAYGVEFSQDGTKAYATVTDSSSKIYQWDLNSTDVQSSILTIVDLGNQTSGALQLGPDAKIYHSIIGNSRLNVINNPDEIGVAANYTQNLSQGAIPLNNRTGTFGLPPFIQSLFSKRIPIVDTSEEEVIEQLALCDTYTYTLSYENISGATYTWSKNGEVLLGETDYFIDIAIDDTAEFPIQENYRLEVDLNTGECPLIGVAQLTFLQSPDYSNGELIACADVGEDAIFDLTQIKNSLAEETQTELDEIEVDIYRSQEDAEMQNNPIPVISNFENTEGLASVFINISTFQTCNEIIEFELVREEFPAINLDTVTVPYCVENFSNPITINALEDDEDPQLYEFLWETGEQSRTIEVNTTGSYLVDIKFKGKNCFVTKTILVEESQPSFNSETIDLCDTYQYTAGRDEFTEGEFTWFQNNTLLPSESNSFLTINIQQDAEFPISNTYTLEVDLEDGSCLKTFEYVITFNKTPNYKEVELETCDNFDLGYGIFNLEDSKTEMVQGIDGVSPEDLSVRFFKSRADALNIENEIQDPQNFENIMDLNRVFGIVEVFESCITLVEIKLNSFSFPNINPQKEFLTYCLEDFPKPLELNALTLSNNTNNYTFLWSTSATSKAIEINQAGIYTVEISALNNDCVLTKEFEIRESNIASFDYKVERFNDFSTIEILIVDSSFGEYEFAIDEPNNFQESNTFENLRPGIYKVYVRDRFGCGIAEKNIGVLGIMKFFSPNGDGINEYWKISGLLENNTENIKVQVYNRYGKLLSEFTNQNKGWNGTYNEREMPSDDYWYRVHLPDGTVETGNFTLKR